MRETSRMSPPTGRLRIRRAGVRATLGACKIRYLGGVATRGLCLFVPVRLRRDERRVATSRPRTPLPASALTALQRRSVWNSDRPPSEPALQLAGPDDGGVGGRVRRLDVADRHTKQAQWPRRVSASFLPPHVIPGSSVPPRDPGRVDASLHDVNPALAGVATPPGCEGLGLCARAAIWEPNRASNSRQPTPSRPHSPARRPVGAGDSGRTHGGSCPRW